MVTILSIKEIDMEGDPAMIAKSSEEFLHQLEIKGPDLRPSQFHVKNEIRSQGATMGFSGIYREGEKPVTVLKNLSDGLGFVVMGPHWVAWKKDEKVAS